MSKDTIVVKRLKTYFKEAKKHIELIEESLEVLKQVFN